MNMLKARFRTLTGREWTRADFPSRWSSLEQAMRLSFSPSDWTEWDTWDQTVPNDSERTTFIQAALSEMYQDYPCSPLMTDTGYMAKAPKALEATDVLCAIYNCSKVALMRPNRDGLTYTLLGFAYVHGFDYREWTVWSRKGDSQEFMLI